MCIQHDINLSLGPLCLIDLIVRVLAVCADSRICALCSLLVLGSARNCHLLKLRLGRPVGKNVILQSNARLPQTKLTLSSLHVIDNAKENVGCHGARMHTRFAHRKVSFPVHPICLQCARCLPSEIADAHACMNASTHSCTSSTCVHENRAVYMARERYLWYARPSPCMHAHRPHAICISIDAYP